MCALSGRGKNQRELMVLGTHALLLAWSAVLFVCTVCMSIRRRGSRVYVCGGLIKVFWRVRWVNWRMGD